MASAFTSYSHQRYANRRRRSRILGPSAMEEPEKALDMEGNQVLVSIVVPTCNRPDLLNRCLEALMSQRFDTACYEIIVVDDGPNLDTRFTVSRWTARALGRGPIVGYVATNGTHGPAAARNVGWRAARGEIIAFTDDDTIPDCDWLRNGVRAFIGKAHAAWGRIIMPMPARPTDFQLDAKGLERAEFATANCFCLRRVLETVNGFDERFHMPWREDADLYFRLLHYDAHVVYIPDAVVVHPVRKAPWGVSVLQQKKVFFDALLFKKHPALYREKIRRSPRWDYYAIVAFLLVFLAGLALHWPIVSIAAATSWLFLTGRFCFKRLRHTSRSPFHVVEMIVTSAIIPPLSVFWRCAGAIRFRVRFV